MFGANSNTNEQNKRKHFKKCAYIVDSWYKFTINFAQYWQKPNAQIHTRVRLILSYPNLKLKRVNQMQAAEIALRMVLVGWYCFGVWCVWRPSSTHIFHGVNFLLPTICQVGDFSFNQFDWNAMRYRAIDEQMRERVNTCRCCCNAHVLSPPIPMPLSAKRHNFKRIQTFMLIKNSGNSA